MRIAILADSWLFDPAAAINGTQVQMYHLASALRRRGHEVHYLSLTRDRGALGGLPEGIRFHWIERPVTAVSWIRDLSDYREALDRIRPDALYQRGRSHLTWIAARWARAHGCRFVWGSNGEDACDFWKHVKRIHTSRRSVQRKAALYPLAAARDLLVHRGIRGASGVVTQTRTQAESLRRNFHRDGVVLPSMFEAGEGAPGGTPAFAKASAGEPAFAEASAGKPAFAEKERIVLWLASLSHGKQPELFLDLADGCRDLASWSFLLGGGTRVDAYRREIEARAASVPNARLLGAVPFAESHALYARAALFASTSRSEADGLPNAFIQAWLHGTPVLSLHHDPNGWIEGEGLGFCARGDAKRLLAGARALLGDDELRTAMGARCARFARETFSAEETIDAYLALFSRA
jgi:glycosyltransferase involved in cell wall biosynthesis